jgi:hypothetical protein
MLVHNGCENDDQLSCVAARHLRCDRDLDARAWTDDDSTEGLQESGPEKETDREGYPSVRRQHHDGRGKRQVHHPTRNLRGAFGSGTEDHHKSPESAKPITQKPSINPTVIKNPLATCLRQGRLSPKSLPRGIGTVGVGSNKRQRNWSIGRIRYHRCKPGKSRGQFVSLGRLLLGHAMQCAEAEDQIARGYADHFAIRE